MSRYEEVQEMPRSIALELLEGDDGPARARALLSLAYFDDDWQWVQNCCLSLLSDGDDGMRATAVLALAHIARLRRQLDLDRVLPALQTIENDPNLAGRVKDALDDIHQYVAEA